MAQQLVWDISDAISIGDRQTFEDLVRQLQTKHLVAIGDFGETDACQYHGDVGPVLKAARSSDPFFLRTLLHKLEELGGENIAMAQTLHEDETAFEIAVEMGLHENLRELLRCVGGISTLAQKRVGWPEELLQAARERVSVSPTSDRKTVLRLLESQAR